MSPGILLYHWTRSEPGILTWPSEPSRRMKPCEETPEWLWEYSKKIRILCPQFFFKKSQNCSWTVVPLRCSGEGWVFFRFFIIIGDSRLFMWLHEKTCFFPTRGLPVTCNMPLWLGHVTQEFFLLPNYVLSDALNKVGDSTRDFSSFHLWALSSQMALTLEW